MQPALIISYFFPPCNLTASLRLDSWYRYLPKYGIKPIVITRKWSEDFQSYADASKPILGDEEVQDSPDRCLIQVPYHGNLRDRLLSEHGYDKYRLLRRLLSFREIIFQNYSLNVIPYRNIYDRARKYLREHPEVRTVIISANPYPLFFFGYKLKQEFPDLKWYADYRDDWSTRTLTRVHSFLGDLIHRLESRSERKWVHSAEAIISVSDLLTDRIGKFVDRPGFTIANGFFEEDFENLPGYSPDPAEFVLTYTGQLYASQDLKPLARCIERLVRDFRDEVDIKLRFIGTAYEEQTKKRIDEAFRPIIDHVQCFDRLPTRKAVEIENESDVLLAISYGEHKGIPGSKLYQYVAHGKPVLLYPNDHDVMESILEQCNVLFTAKDEEGLYTQVKALVERKKSDLPLVAEVGESAVKSFSRKHQAKLLAEKIRQE